MEPLQAVSAPYAANPQAATAAAIQEVINQLMGQANMLAIADSFFFTLAITVVALVLVLLIPIPPQPKGTAKPVLME